MKAQLSKIFQRIKSLGIGEPVTFSHVFQGKRHCMYWSQENLRNYHQWHAGPNEMGVITGCPKDDPSEWIGLGTGSDYGSDYANFLEGCKEDADRCSKCDFYLQKEDWED
jgi:hypothetical protein